MKITAATDGDEKPIRMSAKLINKGHLPVMGHSLNEMAAVAHLYGPWKCNDFGRWIEPHGSIIRIPGLSKKAVTQAINSLIERKIIEKWTINNQDCYELAGAYSFKKLTTAVAKRKIEELMHPSITADETTPADRIEVVRKVVHRKNSTEEVGTAPSYFNNIPGPGKRGKKLLIQPPAKVESSMLRMVSPHNVYSELSPLGCCIRLMLEMVADDLGRVAVDLDDLSSRLGRKIMGRSSKQNLQQEIERMAEQGHLRLFERGGVTCAYICDAAQHGMKKKRLTAGLPYFHPEHPEWTLDTAENLFFYTKNYQAHARNLLAATSNHYVDKGGTRLNEVYRPMSYFGDQLDKEIAGATELIKKAGLEIPKADDFIRNSQWGVQSKFFVAVEHKLEELALEIYYMEELEGPDYPSRLTTLDTESRVSSLLAPALFQLRYGLTINDYVAALEAKWLPKWRYAAEQPFGLKLFNLLAGRLSGAGARDALK